MPRFTLRTLFVVVTLIGLGVCGMVFAFQPRRPYNPDPYPLIVVLPVYIASGGAIGAGLGAIFHRIWIGALLAIAACVGLLFT